MARGFEVALEIEPMLVKEGRPIVFGIKSNMIGGFPGKKQANRKDSDAAIIEDVCVVKRREK